MNTLQVRVDEKTKQDAQLVLDALGLDLSAAVKIYLRQISRTKGIPFSLITGNGFTSEEETKLIKESNRTLASYQKKKIRGYRSTKALMDDLLR